MRVISSVALLVMMSAVAAPARAQRLARNVIPEHYDLLVTPDLSQATFAGDETIQATI